MKRETDEPHPSRDDRQRQREEARRAERAAARRQARSSANAGAGTVTAQPGTAEVPAIDVTPASAADAALERRREQARRARRSLARQRAKADEQRLEALQRQVAELRASGRNLDHRRLRRAWVVPVTQPMALISQVPRSGGTLLARLFDQHAACFTHPLELRWGRPSKLNWPSFDVDSRLSAEEAYALLDEEWAGRFVTQGGYSKFPKGIQKVTDITLSPFVYDSDLAFDIFADAYRRESPTTRRAVLDAHLTSLFNAWLDYQNLYAGPKRWVIAFLPTIVTVGDSVERFFADYPDGRLLTMVRHPGSWFASYHVFSSHRGPVDLSASMSLWLDSAKASLAAAERYGERVIVVIFEDLVLHTEATMRGLASRLDIAFDPVMLHPTFNGMPVLSDSSFQVSTAIDRETTTRDVTKLSPEQRAEIAREALPIYDELVRRHGLASV